MEEGLFLKSASCLYKWKFQSDSGEAVIREMLTVRQNITWKDVLSESIKKPEDFLLISYN